LAIRLFLLSSNAAIGNKNPVSKRKIEPCPEVSKGKGLTNGVLENGRQGGQFFLRILLEARKKAGKLGWIIAHSAR
jgi:hypothetical protein